METGTIIWFDWRKGYGFIRRDSGGRDVHIHWKGVVQRNDGPRGERGRFVVEPSQSLQKGDRVEFETEDTVRGPRAMNVRLLAADTKPSADTEGERGAPIVEMVFDLGIK